MRYPEQGRLFQRLNGAAVDPSQKRQAGFTLVEVMFASIALAVIVLATTAFFSTQSRVVAKLVLRQQAMFAAHAAMERITALYTYTNFGASGPTLTSGYIETAALPTSRYIYPTTLMNWMSNGGPDVIVTNPASMPGRPFHVYYLAGGTATADRTYVWINENRRLMGRLSWVASNIVVGSCTDGGDCKCTAYSGVGAGNCQTLEVILDYPYYLNPAGTIVPPNTLTTITLNTIVGRGE